MKKVNTINQIFKILAFTSKKDKYNLAFLSLFVFFTSCSEVLSVYLVIPVYKILFDKERLSEAIPWLSNNFNISFNSSQKEEFFALSLFALIFIISNSLKTFVNWQAGKKTGSIGASIFSRAYAKVLSKPYDLLSKDNLSRYSSNFLTTNTYFIAVLKNLILLINYVSTCILLFITLIILNSKATIFAILFLILPYYTLTKISKPILKKVSRQIAFFHEDINRYIQEGFKSLKTIKHFNAQNYYTNMFYSQESKLREKIALGEFFEAYPRFLLEGLGLTMITVLYGSSIFIEQINIPNVYFVTLIFASQKILPTIQQIYRIWSYIINFSSSVEDLYKCLYEENNRKNNFIYSQNKVIFKKVYFSYFDQKNISHELSINKDRVNDFSLDEINLEMDYPASISITGNSGCGKTTFVDLLTGLLSPIQGTIYLPEELKLLKKIGYVPQEVPIINGSIVNNICLGEKELSHDIKNLNKSLEIVRLTETIKKLPFGLDTILGEQAINLSGGQKQRLGIARALVRNPKIIILDESTNALDSKSENLIIDNILKEFSNSLILIITHNHKLAEKCQYNLNFNSKGEIKYTNN